MDNSGLTKIINKIIWNKEKINIGDVVKFLYITPKRKFEWKHPFMKNLLLILFLGMIFLKNM